MKELFKKNWLLAAVVAVNGALLVFQPKMEMTALRFTGKNFLNFLFMLTPIFICIGLMDIWIERDTMVKIMGETSGWKGSLTALLLGMVTAVPLYALLPVAEVLLKKGSRISNVLLFLCASASIRIPLLLFEISSLGWRFTLVRFGLNVLVVIAIAFVIEKRLTAADKEMIRENCEKYG
ncbi:MAG: permease [Hydrogeniiclostridium mannosilyticum]